MVLGCTISVLVLNGGDFVKDVAVADSINFVAGVAILVFGFMEPEGKSALDILFHSFSCKWNAKKSGEEAMDVVGDVVAVDMVHKGWTCKLL